MMKTAITLDQIYCLEIDGLRLLWRQYFKSDPPKFNRASIERRLAYEIQKLEYGGLSTEAKSRIERLKTELDPPRHIGKKSKSLQPGSIIVKTHGGIEHRVTVIDKGFEYRGERFSNLSVIARLITGTRWSGPAFFGLTETVQ